MGHASEYESQTGSQPGSQTGSQPGLKTLGAGYLFGVPMGDLGWFASLLMSLASGFMAFFAGTFLGIVGILLYNGGTHGTVDLALSYKRFGLSAGFLVLAVALGYLGTLWIRRKTRHS